MSTDLLQPFKLNNSIELQNRILMAPLTRCMADDNLVPTQAMVDYYARRADSGLIISEATIIRPDAQGYPNTPGLFTSAQIQGWKKVTDAVHEQGGKMFAQLWHVGRVAHPHFFDGDVLAPSAIGVEGSVPRMRELTYITPKAATTADIKSLIADYAKAAENALEAGFDGVEIHGANGYLIDQFLHYAANERDDEYGQTPENMSRFALEVVDAVINVIGADKTGLRLSPGAYGVILKDEDGKALPPSFKKGDDVIDSPSDMFVLSTDYYSGDFRFGISAKYTGERLGAFLDEQTRTRNKVDGYTVLDINAGYAADVNAGPFKSIDIAFAVTNVTDKQYLAGGTGNGSTYFIGAPRTAALTFTANF